MWEEELLLATNIVILILVFHTWEKRSVVTVSISGGHLSEMEGVNSFSLALYHCELRHPTDFETILQMSYMWDTTEDGNVTHGGGKKLLLSEHSCLSWLDFTFVPKAFSDLCYVDAFQRAALQKHRCGPLTNTNSRRPEEELGSHVSSGLGWMTECHRMLPEPFRWHHHLQGACCCLQNTDLCVGFFEFKLFLLTRAVSSLLCTWQGLSAH